MLAQYSPVIPVPKSVRNQEASDAPPQRLAQGLVGVAGLVNRLTRPVLGNRGFAGADVIAHWSTIVGPELASVACPLSMKFDRHNRYGATLMIRVASGAAATLLQFKTPQIIERINRFFGYQAVSKLSVTLGALPKPVAAANTDAAPASPEETAAVAEHVANVSSPALRLALSQLGLAVRRRSAGGPEET